MGRRLTTKWDIPYSIVKIVVTVCADYDRRRIAIDLQTDTPEVLREYGRLNHIVDEALLDIEEGIRRVMLDDVSLGRGYDFSPASPFLAKNTYYQRKCKLVHDIARGMMLV
jgi:hypothetical protein